MTDGIGLSDAMLSYEVSIQECICAFALSYWFHCCLCVAICVQSFRAAALEVHVKLLVTLLHWKRGSIGGTAFICSSLSSWTRSHLWFPDRLCTKAVTLQVTWWLLDYLFTRFTIWFEADSEIDIEYDSIAANWIRTSWDEVGSGAAKCSFIFWRFFRK